MALIPKAGAAPFPMSDNDDLKQAALEYHRQYPPGKI